MTQRLAAARPVVVRMYKNNARGLYTQYGGLMVLDPGTWLGLRSLMSVITSTEVCWAKSDL